MDYLVKEDINDNIVIIKINKAYRENMSALELYDTTRGCWKRKIESVEVADYALCVHNKIVKEVYKINRWMPAVELHRETIPYIPEDDDGRIGFDGVIADESIRQKYIGKSVANLYKHGEADPVKVLLKWKGKKRYWTIYLGQGSQYWENCYKNGYIAIGWDEQNLGDLTRFTSEDEIEKIFEQYDETPGKRHYNDVKCCWEFGNVMKEGDIVFVNGGRTSILGVGEVVSNYYLDDVNTYRHRRKVKWISNDEKSIEQVLAIKTLTDITDLPEILNELKQLYELDGTKELIMNTVEFEKNTILYGPPGTGKTYNTVNYAVAICEGKSVKDVQDEDYDEVLKRYDELKKKGRIAFTTFHQSYGYEEFIEGIRPSVNDDAGMVEYNVEDGIFKAFCDEATITEDDINLSATSYLVRLGYKENDLKDECFRYGVIRFDWDINAKDGGDASFYRWFSDMKQGDYVLSYHSESKYIDAIGVVTDDEPFFDESKSSHRWTRRVNWMVRGLKEDIVGEFGGKWLSNFVISKIKWLRISDVLKVVRKYNGEDRKSNTKPYVFIIDEINRGNISKIFGELITLIEPSKRIGAKEAMEAVLPYSGGAFGVPDNVYIIGTMNTADRSIALMDTALRRRFNFVECMPNVKVLREKGADKVTDGSETIDVAKILEVMNERISYLYDREHTLGHAFFTPLRENPTVGALANIFKNKIIPLLQEYFYDDYEKIQLVLGDNAKDKEYRFILNEPIDETIFRKGTESLELDIQEKKYSIQENSFNSIESYKQIIG